MKIAGWILGGATLAVAGLAYAKFEVKEGPETCSNAHLVIAASASGKHDVIWSAVAKVAKTNPWKWRIQDDYEPGVAERVSLRQYDIAYRDGATAYVMHCGHGGTCNSFAQAFFAEHANWYSPEVFCGPVPQALQNGVQPSLP